MPCKLSIAVILLQQQTLTGFSATFLFSEALHNTTPAWKAILNWYLRGQATPITT